jgi:PIN domain nuclease of toxin-antitoxin system
MNILLDTHTLIWFVEGNSNLSAKAKMAIENEQNQSHVSMASFYEMAIKLKIGKLFLVNSLQEYFGILTLRNVVILPISATHLFEYENVPMITGHHDPFDRLIISTAIVENLPIVTIDKQFDNYKELIQIIW